MTKPLAPGARKGGSANPSMTKVLAADKRARVEGKHIVANTGPIGLPVSVRLATPQEVQTGKVAKVLPPVWPIGGAPAATTIARGDSKSYTSPELLGHATPDVFRNGNSNVVCVYSRAPLLTHFLGIDGSTLTTQHMTHAEFAEEYKVPTGHTALDFARTWTRSETAVKMVPISGSAFRVLKGILGGSAVGPDEAPPMTHLNNLEKHMAKAAEVVEGFRKPDGPVAKVHAFLDGWLEKIKAGTVSRKELIEKLVGKGYSEGTVTTQAGVWARNNGVTFTRPTAAAGAAKEARKTKKVAPVPPAKGKKAAAKKVKKVKAQPAKSAPEAEAAA